MRESPFVRTQSYITFSLGDELFAIDVHQVREVLDLTPITRIPSAPPYVRGVVNVRGTAIPVVDLRVKFGLPRVDDTSATRILVLELELDGEAVVVGGLADSVNHVVEFGPRDVAEAPRVAMRWRAELITGISRIDEQFVILLDIAQLFRSDASALRLEGAADQVLPLASESAAP